MPILKLITGEFAHFDERHKSMNTSQAECAFHSDSFRLYRTVNADSRLTRTAYKQTNYIINWICSISITFALFVITDLIYFN